MWRKSERLGECELKCWKVGNFIFSIFSMLQERGGKRGDFLLEGSSAELTALLLSFPLSYPPAGETPPQRFFFLLLFLFCRSSIGVKRQSPFLPFSGFAKLCFAVLLSLIPFANGQLIRTTSSAELVYTHTLTQPKITAIIVCVGIIARSVKG